VKTELYATHYIYRVDDTAVASIHRQGDHGIVFGMLGAELLVHLLHDLERGLIKNAGIRILEGYVSESIAAAIEWTLRDSENCSMTLSDTCHSDNRDSVWVRVERTGT